jgi:hypothetical protein
MTSEDVARWTRRLAATGTAFPVQCGRSAAWREARAALSRRACICRPYPRPREQQIRLRHRAVPAQPDGALLWGILRSVHDAEDILRRPICAHGVPPPSSKPVFTWHLAVSSRRCAARMKASSNGLNFATSFAAGIPLERRPLDRPGGS